MKNKFTFIVFLASIVAAMACSYDWNQKTEFINSNGANLGLYTSIGTNYEGKIRVIAGYTSDVERVLVCTHSTKSCYGNWFILSQFNVTNRSYAVDSGWVNPIGANAQGIKSSIRIQNAQQANASYEWVGP